ncbi:MAG TPA: asparagine synthase (glutamine-hydrolyzing) [Steroidobacteraceae bacterium]|nr:asparagine synthase (glutamine-hydrolyzing) [Steroidobacteraceae bacterium]
MVTAETDIIMCGIAGYLTTSFRDDLSASLRRMANAIAHRGPDGEGFFETPADDGACRVGLAHRRLAIIDLATGQQPMGNEDGSVQIVFNGEVYNFQELREQLAARGYSFRTRSDTETIVHAYEEWGPECVSRLRGMFAFAIWDQNRERLFIARDRYGKKPLFMYESGGLLLFASEIKAILAFPGCKAAVDRTAVWEYFSYRYVPAPATLFSGIRKLMPGSYVVAEAGKVTETRYFWPADRKAHSGGAAPPDPVGDFLTRLDEAVRIRMISDVPFGAFLSGGIDSSAVVALMSRHSGLPVRTFSAGFTESAYSELGYARTIARHFKTDHHELRVSQHDLMQHLPALVRSRDAPVSEPSDIPIYLLSVEAGRTVKMVLTGEGSDEFLGGYPKHVLERCVSAYQWLPETLRNDFVAPVSRRLPYGFRRVKTAVANLGLSESAERLPRWFGALTHAQRRELLAVPVLGPRREPQVQFDTEPGNSALRRILYFDQTSWLPDNLLERGDRMTMAASIEARMPFMDHELAAFVSALSDEWRVRGRTTKRILRESMLRLLPAAILERPKVGFRVPVNEWFRTSMKEYLGDHLFGGGSRTHAYYRPQTLRRYFDEHVAGRQNHEKLLWSMLNLEIWHREYGVSA